MWIWGALMAAIGLMMAIGGATKGDWIPYKWLHARAAILWKDRAHVFLLVSGLIVATLGSLSAAGVIWK